jgi:acetyltransferase-like isoleucine patch superfamily enzyme
MSIVNIIKKSGIYMLYRWLMTSIVRIRWRLAHAHSSSRIIKPRFLSRDLSLGEYVFINSGAYICPKVQVGKYTMFGPMVTIAGADHVINAPGVPMHFSGRADLGKTLIGEDVWIGANVCILAGVTIGRGSVIGMGSVVTKNVPPYSIAVGVPAKVVRARFTESEIELHEFMLQKPAERGMFCED